MLIVTALIIGLLVGFSIDHVLLLVSQAKLTKQVKEWKTRFEEAQNQLVELRGEYEVLKSKYEGLKEAYEESSRALEELESYTKAFRQQVEELFYYRCFTLYNYKTRAHYHAWYEIKAVDYYKYRFDVETHTPAQLESRLTKEILVKTFGSWREQGYKRDSLRSSSDK